MRAQKICVCRVPVPRCVYSFVFNVQRGGHHTHRHTQQHGPRGTHASNVARWWCAGPTRGPSSWFFFSGLLANCIHVFDVGEQWLRGFVGNDERSRSGAGRATEPCGYHHGVFFSVGIGVGFGGFVWSACHCLPVQPVCGISKVV